MYFGTATDNGELNNTEYVRILTNQSEFGQLTPSNGMKPATGPGKCYAWDVLNEALNEDGTYRNSTFYSVLGAEYIKIAFRTAALADPGAKLYYNDYSIERVSNKSNSARQNIIRLLQDDGIRIDGVGLQSHFTVGRAPTVDQQIENMKLFADMGLDIAITELDVRIQEPENSTNLARQAKVYEDSVGVCMQVDACVGVTVWDFYDPFSWAPNVFPGYGSADLWFANFTKHPAYQGIVNALKNGTDSSDDCDEDEDEDENKTKRSHHWWRL